MMAGAGLIVGNNLIKRDPVFLHQSEYPRDQVPHLLTCDMHAFIAFYS